jgi:lipid-binding SYLF domain-containing protein
MSTSHVPNRRSMLPLFAGMIFGLSSCGPDNIAYQSLQDARVIDGFRLDGRVDDATFADAVGVVVMEIGGGGLGIGMYGGHGVAIRRLADGWSAPLPLDYISGSIGLQIGGTSTEIILVFRSDSAFNDFVFEGTRFLATASGTAISASGGVGDPLDGEETLVIDRSSGLYGGAVIGGLGVSIDEKLMRSSYGAEVLPLDVLSGQVDPPAGATSLWRSLDG